MAIEEDPEPSWAAKKRRQWLFSVATQRLSSSPLEWGAMRRPRWKTVAVILALHVLVLSLVIYFNSTAMIPVPPPISVDVIQEPAADAPVQP